ncbi:MAG: hypothetical protein FJ224_06635 [Lentisphaerae bacterium]|nr:hypothetical protein [Lentisphaerota bacterium]
MTTRFLSDGALKQFVQALMAKGPVIGPVARKSRFVFAALEAPEDLRLDYDTTILPPKKLFFPTKQDLVKFDSPSSFSGCVEPKEQVLLGVHPHDIKGIDMSDKFYAANIPDSNYLAHRAKTTIIGSNVQKHYKHAFFGSVCRELKPQGHDMFLTRLKGGYLVEVRSKKGEELLALGKFEPASREQAAEAEAVNAAAEKNCPEKLNDTSDSVREKVRASFGSDIWNELSRDCFSCGSCNIVCPTCFCFDVQDEWNLDGVSGVRSRCWDACLVSEFSEVSVQGGSENFREERAERYRHRFMRKAVYLNDALGGPACVGCGRCSGACTADIANPTVAINTIMER